MGGTAAGKSTQDGTASDGIDGDHFVVISGCSSGGKSTLLAELARRGYATVDEPGRRIVREEMHGGGTALPWMDATAFLHRAIALSLADRRAAAANDGWVFFDRGLIDAVAGLAHVSGAGAPVAYCHAHRFHKRVFLVPPWPEIYVQDSERRHGFIEALAEYERSLRDYRALGYDVTILPKVSVTERADFLLGALLV